MKKTLFAACILAATAGTAVAGGSSGTIGVGGEYLLTPFAAGGVGGPSVNYDAGAFHVGGFVFLADPGGNDDTVFGLGGRFYYHLHSTAMADFSIGGALGYVNEDTPAGANTGLFLEPGIQVRAFLSSNVALSFTAGFSIATSDADGFALTSDSTGAAGFHYYFY